MLTSPVIQHLCLFCLTVSFFIFVSSGLPDPLPPIFVGHVFWYLLWKWPTLKCLPLAHSISVSRVSTYHILLFISFKQRSTVHPPICVSYLCASPLSNHFSLSIFVSILPVFSLLYTSVSQNYNPLPPVSLSYVHPLTWLVVFFLFWALVLVDEAVILQKCLLEYQRPCVFNRQQANTQSILFLHAMKRRPSTPRNV
jgi:hypothetical protein